MKVTEIFFVLSYAILVHGVAVGSFYISKISGEPSRVNLVRSSDEGSAAQFIVDEDKSILLLEIGKCLSFDKSGKFILATRPRSGFSLKKIPSINKMYFLTYEGSENFYLCGDDRVSISKSCEGARNIEVTFIKELG